jgi:hypothetical protein
MKKISFYFGGTILMVALFAATAFKPASNRPSANGQGTLTIEGDQSRHFAFHVNTMPDGSVQGSGELTYTGGVLKIMFDITCLTVTGNTANMSGVVTRDDENPEFVGTYCRFRVVDNGEGANSVEDKISRLNIGFLQPVPCTTVNLALFPIEGGNIQVKD